MGEEFSEGCEGNEKRLAVKYYTLQGQGRKFTRRN